MTNELTLENIRSGAFPSDAHAVGFLLGEIERLQSYWLGDKLRGGSNVCHTCHAHCVVIGDKDEEIERLERELRLAESARDYANDMLDRARATHEPLEQPVATPGATFPGEDSVSLSAESSRPRELLSQGVSRDASPGSNDWVDAKGGLPDNKL